MLTPTIAGGQHGPDAVLVLGAGETEGEARWVMTQASGPQKST